MRISAYIICKNESAVIARCINSFKNTVDEIIVVDSGSTDNTIEIARSLGAIVYSIQWQDDFSYARNFALQKCSGDWIIPLDADEYFRDDDAAKVLPHIEKLQKAYDGFICKLVNINPATNKSISQITHLLAFRKTSDLKYYRPIHEQLKKGNKQLNLLYVDDIIILHTGYVLNEEQFKNKTLRNITLLEKKVANNTADADDYFHLTQLYLGSNRSADEVFNVAKKMIDLDKNNNGVSNTATHRKYTLWALAMQKKGYPFTEIIQVLDTAQDKFPHHPEVLAARGDAYLAAKKMDYALSEYKKALAAQKNYHDILSNDFDRKVPDVKLLVSELYLFCHKPLKALDYCFDLVRGDKYMLSATLMLLHLIRSQSAQDIVVLLDTIYDRNKKEDVEYLIRCLLHIRIPLLFNFYEKIWNTRFGVEDTSIIAALLCLGNYKTAVDIAQNYLSDHQNSEVSAMSCAGIILGDLFEDYKLTIKQNDKQSYAIIDTISRLKSGQPINSLECQQNQLERVFYHIVQSLSDDDAQPYIESVVFLNDIQIIESFVKDLLYIRRYSLLSWLYDYWAKTDPSNSGENLFYSGLYAMLNGTHNKAMEQFLKVSACGFDSPEMHEYMRIINNSC